MPCKCHFRSDKTDSLTYWHWNIKFVDNLTYQRQARGNLRTDIEYIHSSQTNNPTCGLRDSRVIIWNVLQLKSYLENVFWEQKGPLQWYSHNIITVMLIEKKYPVSKGIISNYSIQIIWKCMSYSNSIRNKVQRTM